MLFRPAPVLTAFALPALIILMVLGGWQWQRMGWKQGLLDLFESRLSAEPVPVADALALEDPAFLPVRVEGNWLDVAPLRFGLGRDGIPVWRWLQPVETPSGTYLVLRGYADYETPTITATGPAAFEALVLPDPARGLFPPPNRPDLNIWRGWDLPAMAQAMGLAPQELHPVVLARTTPADPAHPELKADPPKIDMISNRHFEYAMTWWLLGLTLIGIYIGLHVREVRIGRANEPPAA